MTTAHAVLLGLIAPAYLLGSMPFGLLVARTRGVDPRKAGSGNIGATNVGRLLGIKFFLIVFVLDLLKGLLPALAGAVVLASLSGKPDGYVAQDYLLWLLVGFAAVFGHMYSVYLGFKGGKGVATSAGVVLGIYPYYTLAGIVALLTWAIVLKLTKFVSVASMAAAVVFPVAYVVIGTILKWQVAGQQWPLLLFACLTAVMIVYKHRTNLMRLRAGTEVPFNARGERA